MRFDLYILLLTYSFQFASDFMNNKKKKLPLKLLIGIAFSHIITGRMSS